MLNVYSAEQGVLVRSTPEPGARLPADAVWFDLLEPTADDIERVQAHLRIALPTRAEMEEIEHSSRLYRSDAAMFMTATVIAGSQTRTPDNVAVAFVLSRNCLTTLRYADLQSFREVESRLSRHLPGSRLDGEAALLILLDAIIDRVADLLELVGREVDDMSHSVFRAGEERAAATDFNALLRRIGSNNDLTSRARESLMTLSRVFGFLSSFQNGTENESTTRLEMLHRDADSIGAHADFLSNKLTFLLDASLGLINIEQNAIIKIFSVAAVVLLPPTLIASIYGMNFRVMPELDWRYGYLFALGLMLASAALTYAYFKRRRWL